MACQLYWTTIEPTHGSLISPAAVDDVSDSIFSDELTHIFEWIIFSLLAQAICIFGVGSNIINIMCFIKLGFKDSVNVNFLGLTIADIGFLTTLMWTIICVNPAFAASDLPFEPLEFQYITSGMMHVTFTNITSWMTALITLERCVCVIAPIKVRSIVTTKRVFIIVICVYAIILASAAPVYAVNRLGAKFYPERNRTLIGIISTRNGPAVEKVSYVINNVCTPCGAFTLIITCTLILVIKLKNNMKWRKTSTLSTQDDNVSVRHQKVTKMVVIISILFIVSFTPYCIIFIAMSIVPDLSFVGIYRNALFIFGGLGTIAVTINSSSNIFIYYHMSTKYRDTLRCMLPFKRNF